MKKKKNHLALNISIISDIINEVTRSHIVSHCLLTVLPLLSLLATLENLRFPGIEQFFPYSGSFRVSGSTPKRIKVFTKKKKIFLPHRNSHEQNLPISSFLVTFKELLTKLYFMTESNRHQLAPEALLYVGT